MKPNETHLQMARRHVAEGTEHIRRQEQLIAELKADGHLTDQAEELLATMRESQRLHEEDLSRLLNKGAPQLLPLTGRSTFLELLGISSSAPIGHGLRSNRSSSPFYQGLNFTVEVLCRRRSEEERQTADYPGNAEMIMVHRREPMIASPVELEHARRCPF